MDWTEQILDQLWNAWLYLSTSRVFAIVLGVGFAVLALGLYLASKTKWGRSKPLTKFVVVSVVLHVWLLMYAVGSTKVLPQGDSQGREHAISVSFQNLDEPVGLSDSDADLVLDTSEMAPLADLEFPEVVQESIEAEEPAPLPLLPDLSPTLLQDLPPEVLPPLEEVANNPVEEVFEPIEPSALPPLPELPPDEPAVEETVANDGTARALPDPQSQSFQSVTAKPNPVQRPEQQLPRDNLPEEYRLRQAPDRLKLARAFGADEDTEAAVAAGLKWLAEAQSSDGSWSAVNYGGGTETRALDLYRHGTGDKADSGVSGLALLAFLSAGHTHQSGEYQQTVGRALGYLIRNQMPSGDMSGPKQVGSDPAVLNSRMYCHGIATLAIAEAHAMTQDPALRPALLKAAQYTINAQDIRGGGWRYRPGDPGDLSQFGWQAMGLKSVERSGIQIPIDVQRRMRRFLDSCAAGRFGGLATYRPREGRPSETMTAESLACRLLMDYPLSASGRVEAKQMIMRNLPGSGTDNVYFWYYATLALFQLQDEDWRVWNQAMKARLLQSQVPPYADQAGSWDPDSMWGGYGGRVYSTAMSSLCLEVYYRYLPMYRQSNLARARPIEPMQR